MARRKRRKKLKPSSTRPAGHGVVSPTVAIVGRPNVGKSSLFNRLLGERAAIVEATAGVTRDRLIRPIRMDDYQLDFDLMDTGGIGIVDRADLAESVEMQVETGLHAAQVALEGLAACPLDPAKARRRASRPTRRRRRHRRRALATSPAGGGLKKNRPFWPFEKKIDVLDRFAPFRNVFYPFSTVLDQIIPPFWVV